MKLNGVHLDKTLIDKAVTIKPDASLVDARKRLLLRKTSRLVVINERKARKRHHSSDKNIITPIGIITEKDVAKTFYKLGNRSAASVRVHDFMSKNLLTVKIGKDSVYDCARIMKSKRISSVIVVDNDDHERLAGIITKTTLLRIFLKECVDSLKISQAMSSRVVTVSPNDSLLYVESVLINNRISRVVVTRGKRPVGMITFRDFIPARLPHWIEESADPKEVKRYKYGLNAVTTARVNQMAYLLPFSAVDIMSTDPIVIKQDDMVTTAAALMIEHDISGLPVVKGKRLVGIITKTDIVNMITR